MNKYELNPYVRGMQEKLIEVRKNISEWKAVETQVLDELKLAYADIAQAEIDAMILAEKLSTTFDIGLLTIGARIPRKVLQPEANKFAADHPSAAAALLAWEWRSGNAAAVKAYLQGDKGGELRRCFKDGEPVLAFRVKT